MPKLVIDGGEVEVHLAGEFGLEVLDLQLDHHKAAQSQMVEEKIQVIVLAADFKMVLAADEREAFPELENKRAQILDQATFKIALQHIWAKRQEVKGIGVLEELLSKLGLLGGQGPREVRQRAALAGKEVALDLVDENWTTPTMFDGLFGIPRTLLRRLDGIK